MKNRSRVPHPRNPSGGGPGKPPSVKLQRLFEQGLQRSDADDHEGAAELFRQVIAQRPDLPPPHFNLARALLGLGRDEEALASLERVLALQPNHSKAIRELALQRRRRGEHAEAAGLWQRLLRLEPGNEHYLNQLGIALFDAGRRTEADQVARQLLELKPDVAAYHYNLGNIVRAQQGDDASIPHYARAVELDPTHAQALASLGAACYRKSPDQAEDCFRKALAIDPDTLNAVVGLLGIELRRCDFEATEATLAQVIDAVDRGVHRHGSWVNAANLSYHALFLPIPKQTVRALQERIADRLNREARARLRLSDNPPGGGNGHRRIRIGYLSPNFSDHPVGHVTLSLFSAHDRERFEVHAISTRRSGSDGSEYARRHRAAFDAFHEIGGHSASRAAEFIHSLGIDILIDLDGYMDTSSPPILAYRPAPVQVFWLGHAGGLGLPFVDYLIADARVVPPGEEGDYREAIARLPETYHCADRHPIAADCPPRPAWNLPEQATVFCAFNNPDKIDRRVFECWMRILQAVDGSVLWLSSFRQNRETLMTNLRARAAEQGVDPARLILSERVPDKAMHLARIRHADLMLDTLTLNASTTALDSLWAGLPLLAVRGDRFSNRISTSMLHALGMEDMVCADLAEYERRAIQLGRDPEARAGLRRRLRENLETHPMFRIERFARHLEQAYETMWARHGRGEAPGGFDVPPLPPG